MGDDVLPDLAELWTRMRPTALERCATVLRGTSTDDPAAHAEARAESHKLAGSLGMYGLADASAIALELDAAIDGGALSTRDGRAAAADLTRALAAKLEAAG